MKIKVLVLDVDGTLTDGKIYMGNGGEIMKVFNVKDGCGIKDILPNYGIEVAIITARNSTIVEKRCKELGISQIYQGCRDKKTKLYALAAEYGFVPNENGVIEEFAYMGDDILDYDPIRVCGMKGCPQDACDMIKCQADYISKNKGGEGAVREFIEYIVKMLINESEGNDIY